MREHQFMQLNEMKVFKKVFLKYKVMIIRAKISFMAFKEGRTINELIISQIIKSYNRMRKQNLLNVDPAFNKTCFEIADKITNNSVAIIKVLMAENLR
jgi:hypothetical protein